jgi:hypothetical protein
VKPGLSDVELENIKLKMLKATPGLIAAKLGGGIAIDDVIVTVEVVEKGKAGASRRKLGEKRAMQELEGEINSADANSNSENDHRSLQASQATTLELLVKYAVKVRDMTRMEQMTMTLTILSSEPEAIEVFQTELTNALVAEGLSQAQVNAMLDMTSELRF